MNIRVNYSSQVSICRFFSVSLPVEITFSSHFTERDLPMHQGEGEKFALYRRNFCNTLLNSRHCLRSTERSEALSTGYTQTWIHMHPGKETNRGLGREKDGVQRARGWVGYGRDGEGMYRVTNYSLPETARFTLLPGVGRKAIPVQIERCRGVYNLHVTNLLPYLSRHFN